MAERLQFDVRPLCLKSLALTCLYPRKRQSDSVFTPTFAIVGRNFLSFIEMSLYDIGKKDNLCWKFLYFRKDFGARP